MARYRTSWVETAGNPLSVLRWKTALHRPAGQLALIYGYNQDLWPCPSWETTNLIQGIESRFKKVGSRSYWTWRVTLDSSIGDKRSEDNVHQIDSPTNRRTVSQCTASCLPNHQNLDYNLCKRYGSSLQGVLVWIHPSATGGSENPNFPCLR